MKLYVGPERWRTGTTIEINQETLVALVVLLLPCAITFLLTGDPWLALALPIGAAVGFIVVSRRRARRRQSGG